ncbi:ATP-dependent helicase/nuclease subunit B [Bacillus pakistanensis]|uniref:ATP-dependent helicase/deoxyribonuclease subunit B n=1 Tax=Rossellomorea pakistanensis TaxID=992288 RepID=A0ABS2NF40_9BACI|nr:helicase-exonuclease AddAB subunit AddB [Bacillus pakistanensis]MBM7586469.1 ATP-dependent helicase/nuclease subunit B [Bacillus pakistanensis]
MSLRFIEGRSGTGKTNTILNEIKEKLHRNPNGHPIIYLVPDQMTFLSEYNIANTPKLGGMIRAQVYSFTRLAWRVLQETGGMSRYHLSNVGLNMMIRKIMDEKKDELKLFTRAADKAGFIEHVESMLTEFKRYCVHPEELHFRIEQMNENEHEHSKVLGDKLHDLNLLYQSFEEKLEDKYIDSEDYFQLLADSIQHSSLLDNAEIYIDGFHSFTPQEYMIIEQLMKFCKRVSIALTVGSSEDATLFRMTNETYEAMKGIAERESIAVEEPLKLIQNKRSKNGSLTYLEEHFENRPIVPYTEPSSLRIWEAANRRAEIEGVAREIRKLARKQNYRYKDMSVLVRNGQDYQELIETIFTDYEIPYFIDQKRTMLNHPLIELIRSTLEIMNTNWRYEPVFRAVKTDLLFPVDRNPHSLREKMDRLENYVLAYGIQGDKWTKKDRWVYRRFRGLEGAEVPQTSREKEVEQEINELRIFISAPILRFARRLQKGKTGRDYCEIVYLYLEELDIPAKLERLSMEAEARGNLIAAREHDQAWQAVMDLLDQFVEILGEDEISVKKFASILETGMESMKFSLVPPAVDQILIANLEQSRIADIKAAFVVGMNDGVMPAKISDDGVLSDEDREILLGKGMKIAPNSKTKLQDEEFVAYKALTTPEESLYISYPIANEEGKALLPSPYIKRMTEMFPDRPIELLVNDPSELTIEKQLDYICHPNVTISYLTSQLQLKRRGYPIYDIWWDVYNQYVKEPGWKEKATHILSSLFYQNRAKKLKEETSQGLYGDQILASVSRMELFHSCPFSHFARHGLKLREREMFRLEAPDIGEMFHAALKWISDEVQKHGLTWAQLSKKQCIQLAEQAVMMLAPKLQNQILLSSNRHHYIKKKLERIIGRASLILSAHAKASGFSPVGLELGFGPQAELPPFTFTLRNGTKMELQGRIDRVDKAEDENGVYLRIVDYKSSARDVDVTEVYYGLALQMLTYLDIVLTNSKKLIGSDALPAGVLYFHVHNPIVNSKKILTLDEIENEIFKSFKMKGLILGESEVVRLMDNTLESGTSDIISAGLKKDGSLSARSKAANQKDFQLMRQHVRKLFEQSGNDIISGKTEISPYKHKDRTPCQFCSYRPVCQFDSSLEENDFRIITSEKQSELFEKMRKEEDMYDGFNDSCKA